MALDAGFELVKLLEKFLYSSSIQVDASLSVGLTTRWNWLYLQLQYGVNQRQQPFAKLHKNEAIPISTDLFNDFCSLLLF